VMEQQFEVHMEEDDDGKGKADRPFLLLEKSSPATEEHNDGFRDRTKVNGKQDASIPVTEKQHNIHLECDQRYDGGWDDDLISSVDWILGHNFGMPMALSYDGDQDGNHGMLQNNASRRAASVDSIADSATLQANGMHHVKDVDDQQRKHDYSTRSGDFQHYVQDKFMNSDLTIDAKISDNHWEQDSHSTVPDLQDFEHAEEDNDDGDDGFWDDPDDASASTIVSRDDSTDDSSVDGALEENCEEFTTCSEEDKARNSNVGIPVNVAIDGSARGNGAADGKLYEKDTDFEQRPMQGPEQSKSFRGWANDEGYPDDYITINPVWTGFSAVNLSAIAKRGKKVGKSRKTKAKNAKRYFRATDVCARRVDKFGRVFYKIHWDGFKLKTWEPMKNFNSFALAELAVRERSIGICEKCACTTTPMKSVAHVCWEFKQYFSVEGVYGRRVQHSGKIEYKVRWDEDLSVSWISEEHLQTSSQKIMEELIGDRTCESCHSAGPGREHVCWEDVELPPSQLPEAVPDSSQPREEEQSDDPLRFQIGANVDVDVQLDIDDSDQSNNYHLIEEVTGRRLDKDGLRYKVKWEGYEEESWEPVANFTPVALADIGKQEATMDACLKCEQLNARPHTCWLIGRTSQHKKNDPDVDIDELDDVEHCCRRPRTTRIKKSKVGKDNFTPNEITPERHTPRSKRIRKDSGQNKSTKVLQTKRKYGSHNTDTLRKKKRKVDGAEKHIGTKNRSRGVVDPSIEKPAWGFPLNGERSWRIG